MKRIKICLCLFALMLPGCMGVERVERHYYHGGDTTQPPPSRQFEIISEIEGSR